MSEIDSGGIFVSYRRQDTRHVAGRLYDRLAERFGRSHVFMDVVSIEPGLDFARTINDGVSGCDVFLVLIGQSWLNAVDEHGRRRLDKPDDLVLLEVKAALDQHVRVIPVLVDGASAPRRYELPKVIADLSQRNWVRINHETFGSDVTVLMDVLDRIIRPDSGHSAARLNVVVEQGNVRLDSPTADSQRASPDLGDHTTEDQALSMPAEEAVTTAIDNTDSTWAVRAIPGTTSTDPTRKSSLKRFWVAASALALLSVVIPGAMVAPRLLGFWRNISLGHPADGALQPPYSAGEITTADSTSKISCGSGHVCIYPEANYGGVPYVLRVTDNSTSLADTPINDKTFSVINNGASPRTARIYRSESYSGPHTCIQPGGRIADLRGFAVGQWGSSLKLNDDLCG